MGRKSSSHFGVIMNQGISVFLIHGYISRQRMEPSPAQEHLPGNTQGAEHHSPEPNGRPWRCRPWRFYKCLLRTLAMPQGLVLHRMSPACSALVVVVVVVVVVCGSVICILQPSDYTSFSHSFREAAKNRQIGGVSRFFREAPEQTTP